MQNAVKITNKYVPKSVFAEKSGENTYFTADAEKEPQYLLKLALRLEKYNSGK